MYDAPPAVAVAPGQRQVNVRVAAVIGFVVGLIGRDRTGSDHS
jgi:hypothetical protein